VPKAHTPFQWAGQLDHETTDHRLKLLRDAINSDRSTAKAIGYRYHDGKPGIVEGLLSRGDRRIGPGDRGGLARRRPVRRLERALLVRPAGRVRRAGAGRHRRGPGLVHHPERDYAEVLPWDHLDAGWTGTGCGQDWQDALDEVEVEDCRWTPCFDCGVCPQLDTAIQVGPTGRSLLPLTPV
jgi:hypothetical protein